MYFDSHMHSEGLGFSELKKLAEVGIVKVCSLAFYPIKPNYPETMIDMFRKLTEFEVERCRAAGVEMYPAVGIHPRCIPPKYEMVLEYLESGNWRAFGEIGLETASGEEVAVLEAQLKIAMKLDVPCIIHTPRSNKREVTEKTISLLKKLDFPSELAVIDHVNFDNLDLVLATDYWIGLTVQPGKLSSEDAAKIVEEYGVERFMLNSDAGYRDIYFTSVAEAARELEKRIGNEVKKIAFENAKRFLRV